MTIVSGKSDPDEVLKILESVKLQQRHILEQLEEQQAEVESDLDVIGLHHLIHDEVYPHVTPGIPEEASFLTCPYDNLKSVVLNEFLLLDKRYKTHLEYLNVKYADVIE
jgi:hypothetical protein